MTIKDCQNYLIQKFKSNSIEQPELESDILISIVMKCDRSYLISHSDKLIPYSKQKIINRLTNERLNGKPIAYILNNKEFYGKNYFVNQSVLIPRPETETLVEIALDTLHDFEHKPIKILEIGTGSGCVAISLLLNSKDPLTITSCDISRKALSVAEFNSIALLNTTQRNRLHLLQRNMLAVTPDYDFSILVSNPPYISSQEYAQLHSSVKDFEPSKALLGGKTGLIFYERIAWIIANAPDDKKRVYLLEINSSLVKETINLFKAWEHHIYEDYRGLPRIIKITK